MAPAEKPNPYEHDVEDAQRERVSGVASSGVRVERETTPAPASAASDEWASLPSARPTSVPDYDVAAVAFETSLRHPALPSLPLDVAVPTRTHVRPPAGLDLRACFLLLHVDGRSSVRDIAELVALPVEEVLGGILDLSARGLVEMDGTQLAHAVPLSGERRR
ncbi:MAG: hypothetical protein JWP87_4466 [Labilithrix sp.]|nr:hypothetical protein [Labilithrix sp.]